MKVFHSPTSPKNTGILTLLSSPACFFMTVVYIPYRTALNAAIAFPTAISVGVLCGKEPRFSSLEPDKSTLEMMIIPVKEAMTPKSLREVNLSTPRTAPKMSVQMPISVVRLG